MDPVQRAAAILGGLFLLGMGQVNVQPSDEDLEVLKQMAEADPPFINLTAGDGSETSKDYWIRINEAGIQAISSKLRGPPERSGN